MPKVSVQSKSAQLASPPAAISLSTEARALLTPLAVVVRPVNRTAWAKLLRSSKVQFEERAVTTNDLRKYGALWVEQGLLSVDPREQFGLTSKCRHELLELLQTAGLLHPALRAWRTAVNPYGYSPHFQDSDLHLSDAWVHLYTGAFSKFEMSLAAYDEAPSLSDAQWGVRARAGLFGSASSAIVDLFGLDPEVRALQLLPNAQVDIYWAGYCRLALTCLLPLGNAAVYWMDSRLLSSDTRALLATCAALRGESPWIARLLPLLGQEQPAPLAARSVIELSMGQVERARALAVRACAAVGSKKLEQRAWLSSPLCSWVALLLCSATEMAEVTAGEHLLRLVESQKKQPSEWMVYEFLREFRRSIDSGQPDPSAIENIVNSAGGTPRTSWLTLLLLVVSQGWLGAFGKRGYEAPVDLDAIVWFATRDGYRWAAAQLRSAAVSCVGAAADGPPPSEPLPGFVPVSQLYQRVSAWESALGTLERLLTSADTQRLSANSGPSEQRLIWVLTPGNTASLDNTATLEARLQSRGKRGFSRGKQLSCGKLAQMRDSALSFLDDPDREVLRHILRYRERGIDRYYLGPEALLALCGHPRVELLALPGQFVSVHARPPRLLVQRQGGGSEGSLRVVLSPAECAEGNTIVEETPDGAVHIIQLDPALADVAQALAHGLSVPPEGERRLTDLIGILSRKFEVHSDVAGTGLQESEADQRIHVRLWRGSSGVRARLGVQPVADVQRWYAPGEGQARLVCEVAGKSHQVRRNLEREQAQVEQLVERCPALQLASRHGEDYVVRDLMGSLDLLLSLQAHRPEVVIHWPEGVALQVSAEKTTQDLEVKVSTSGGMLTFEGSVQISPELKLQMSEVLARVGEATGRFLPLGGDQFLALEDSLLRRLSQIERVQGRQPSGKAKNIARVSVAMAGVVQSLVSESSQAKVGKTAREALLRIEEAKTLEVSPPTGLKAELRGYQMEGLQWLCRLAHSGAGACLADDMGLGKTLQVLALLLQRASEGPALVVAPTSVRQVWLSEAERFAPGLHMQTMGTAERREQLAALRPGDVLVCSYGVMQNQIEQLQAIQFATVVLDEAQAIKNVRAQRTRAALQLQGKFRIGTTGTPIENHLGELWSLQNFLNPGLLGTQQQFEKRFSGPIESQQDRQVSELLRGLIEPFLLRRTKSQVLAELPPKTEVVVSVDLSEEERAFYEGIRQKALRQMKASTSGVQQRMRILAELTRLRRAVCNPDLVVKNSGVQSSKFAAVRRQIQQLIAGGHRALVFSQFVDHLNCVRAWLDDEKIEYQYLVGATSEPKRIEAVEKFQAGKGSLFLISLKAGGFGLNLTQADYVLILDPWWNPAAEDQAADRAHRMGQRKPVTVYRLVARDTIEERIVELHKKKRNLANNLLSGMSDAAPLDLDAMRGLLMQSSLSEAHNGQA